MADSTDASSPLKLLQTPKKSKSSVDLNACIKCQQKGTSDDPLRNSEIGVRNIIDTAISGKDIVTQRLESVFVVGNIQCLQDVDPSTANVRYHHVCYTSYTSSHNVTHTKSVVPTSDRKLRSASKEQDTNVCLQDQSNTQPAPRARRSLGTLFSWKVCMFCQKDRHKDTRKTSRIESDARLVDIKSAIEAKNDQNLKNECEEINWDLFAKDARYHKPCLQKYLHDASSQPSGSKKEETIHDVAFRMLTNDIEDDLFQNKNVYTLTFLLEMYRTFLPENKQDSYSTGNLQAKLKSHYGEAIVLEGKPVLVFSKSVTAADAVKAAKKMKEQAKRASLDVDVVGERVQNGTEEQDITLYNAASILRQAISEYSCMAGGYYPSPEEMSLQESLDKLPPQLLKFVTWLLDKKAFDSVEHKFKCVGSSGEGFEVQSSTMRKATALSECIVGVSKRQVTPFQLGLAVQTHFETGSRQLVDTLSSNGMCAPYEELTKYETSLALHEVSNIKNSAYLPTSIVPIHEGGLMIQEGDDNIDINTETIDGKNTFHSMARVVFQEQEKTTETKFIRVKKLQDRSLTLTPEIESLMQCLPFEKPKGQPEPKKREHANDLLKACSTNRVYVNDVTWVLLRMASRKLLPISQRSIPFKGQVVPFWTGFHSLLSEVRNTYTVASYAPVVDAKPSDMATVYTTMAHCKKMTNALGQKNSVQTMDQQIYAVAQQVKWSRPEEFNDHILRLGGFHTLSCYLVAIGTIWGSAGLKDLLVDSDVYAALSVDHILAGKEFNRAVRAYTLVYEALTQLEFEAFFKWCATSKGQTTLPNVLRDSLVDILKGLNDVRPGLSGSVQELHEVVLEEVWPLFQEFVQESSDKSPTFQFWDQLRIAIEIMLRNIRAERGGDFAAHLESEYDMIPYMSETNRNKYARWLPAYLLDMVELPLEIKQAFAQGQFTIRQTAWKFNGVWSDMAVEKSVIKDSKGKGGIVGMTQKKQALMRWTIARHRLGEIRSVMKIREGISVKDEFADHKQNLPSTMKRDEEHVNALVSEIKDKMINPFDVESHPDGTLVNISTGLHATPEVQSSLLNVVKNGRIASEKFVKNCLSKEGNDSFYSTINKSKLKTFADLAKKTTLKTKGGSGVGASISPEIVFQRALFLSQSREDITASFVYSHPIGPVPPALYYEDGTMRKTTKAELGSKLESKIDKSQLLNTLPRFDKAATVIIRDTMAFVHSITDKDSKGKTFSKIAEQYLSNVCSDFKFANTVVEVFDRYDVDDSIKMDERDRRAAIAGGARKYHVIPTGVVPSMKKFLNVNSNKHELLKFFNSYTVSNRAQHLKARNQKLYLVGGFENPEIAMCLKQSESEIIHELTNNHEEADTRIILALVYFDNCFQAKGVQGRVVLRCTDADVSALAVHYFPSLTSVKELWIHRGVVTSVADLRRFVPVHKICKKLSSTFCKILPAAHALTGCDSTSSFFKIGKTKMFNALVDDKADVDKADEFKGLVKLQGNDVEEIINECRKLVISLYDPKAKSGKHQDLNVLRLYLSQKPRVGTVNLADLPPCEASFRQHCLRASWQTKVWMAAHIAMQQLGNAVGSGWKKEGHGLSPVYFEGEMVSERIDGLICDCKGRKKCATDCSCSDQGLPCTELCFCQGLEICCNENTGGDDVDTSESEDDDA